MNILLKFPILVKLSLAMDVPCRAVHFKFQAGTASKLKRLNAYQNHITASNKHREQQDYSIESENTEQREREATYSTRLRSYTRNDCTAGCNLLVIARCNKCASQSRTCC